jgi:hypothetical protein
MLRKLLLLTLLPVFIFLFIVEAPLAVNAADTVYGRNGEVYVMIGEGARIGVYASQKLDANGNRVTVRPDGVKLFGDPTKMDNYQALAVDQFRNIYVLAAKLDPGLINMPPNSHFWVDPPKEEGICGVGNDGTRDYHDVLNHCDTMPGNPHGGRGVSNRATEKYAGQAGWSYLNGQTPGGGAHSAAGQGYVAPIVPPAADLAVYNAKYPNRVGGTTKRIPLNYWYCGHISYLNAAGATVNCNASTVAWQIKYNVKVQRVNLWISHYVDGAFVPAGALPGLPTDPQITPNVVSDMFEAVFNTVNMQYTNARATMCGEAFHPGSMNPVTGNINTDYKIGFTTTGAGRRYVYSSLPSPKIKKGTIRLTAGNTFGIPQMDSADFNGLDGSQPLTAQTLSMGAATKDPNVDYVYTAPLTDPSGWDIIGFAVADQWDGTGGVRYMLLQAPGAAGKKFDPARGKKLRWAKMNGYVVDAGKSGIIDLNKDVKVVAGDGSGSVYYLTDPRPVFDAGGAGDTFWHPNSTVSGLVPLPTPGKPVEFTTSTGGKEWHWKRKFTGRAATELYQIEYYTKTETKLNDFTVGQQEALVLEVYNDANATILKTRQAIPDVIPPAVASIKLALATINLAGPPTGNNEKMCVDIVSSNVSTANLDNVKRKDITMSSRDGGILKEVKIEGDEITEDTQYRCYMENAPPQFSPDLIKKNIISGLVLKDENGNGTIGGFDYALRPGTACYYWRVEMVEPHKKPIKPDANFNTTTVPARTANLTEMTQAPPGWAGLAGKGPRSQNVNFADTFWYSSRGANADKVPNQENAGAGEAVPDFAFTPKEPGVYRVSLVASAKKWNYGVLGYPSYITDRESAAGCKDGTTHYLFFDNGEGGGTAKNGVKDGGEDYVSERYVVVTAKKTEVDKYITKIKFENPETTVNENEIKTWTVSANLKYIRAIEHDNPNKIMETYNGIGVWDYPDTAVADWGLPALFDGVGENYVTGAPARPSNSVKNGANIVMEPKMRNFGEKAVSAAAFGAAPPELAGVPANIIFGTPPSFPTWVAGAGTNANPTVALNKADRGAIEYEWYLAAEEKAAAGSIFHGAAIDGSVTTLTDPKRFPSILIAKGRLSDERAAGAAGVVWGPNNYINANREFNVKVTLRYAFDMPLDPGRYFLYIKFKYPKLKWEGRSEKKDKDGNIKTHDNQPPKPDKSNIIYAYYDLVSDGTGSTVYHVDNWDALTGNANEPAGLAITVKDKQPPQSYFVSDNPFRSDSPDPNNLIPNPKPNSELAIAVGALPATGVEYIGGTTGDPYRGVVKYNVCDNNPNQDLASSLKALTGKSYNDINPDGGWQTVTMTKTDDKYYEFNEAKLKLALEKTIAPKVAARLPGQVQDAVNVNVNDYPGYGVDAPYRMAKFQLDSPHTVFTKDKIPYDMTGSIPMYAASVDKAGNTITDAVMKAQVKQGIPAQWPISDKHFPNAPARIAIVDNDAPSLRFYALRTRDNVYREYIINASGTPDATTKKPGHHDAYNDELDWDPAAPNKLKFTSWGPTKVNVKDCNLDGTPATLTGQSNPVHAMADMQNNTGMCTQYRPTDNGVDIGVGLANNKTSYLIKFGGRNVGISETYNKYSPTNVAYYEFDKILPANAGDLLELIEDARSKFEIAVVDNVDNTITVTKPVMVTPNALMAGNCYVDTLNLGDPIMLGEVMNSWKTKGSHVETYGIFRDPTPTGPGALQPFMIIAVKDASGNATVIKLPIIIRHTLFRPNVINLDTRRSE